jgi:non-ribosomal peptide synthetase component E (peptide arylation enzyme)
MQKIQILFPDPLMRRIRELAEFEDRPLSEVIRRAVERFAEQSPVVGPPDAGTRTLPTFKGGRMLADSAEMKQLIHQE